jgi:hypothetical protein
VLLYSSTANRDSSGFLFLDQTTQKLAVVASPSRTDLDVTVERHADGSLWLTPARSGVSVTLYAPTPVEDLTSVDRAPATGFAATPLQALPGYAYVFRVQTADGIHFAAVRVAFAASDHIVFDWSFQSAPGNVELSRRP